MPDTLASIYEGICPSCRQRLTPVLRRDTRCHGHCDHCLKCYMVYHDGDIAIFGDDASTNHYLSPDGSEHRPYVGADYYSRCSMMNAMPELNQDATCDFARDLRSHGV